MKETYIVQENQRNALWGYETISDTQVQVTWGRLGTTYSTQVKDFPNKSKRDAFIDKMVREKTGKGYKKVNSDDVKKEEKTADILGAQSKVSNFHKISRRDGNSLMVGAEPVDGLVIEVMNSWTKEVSFFWVGRDASQNYQLSSVTVHPTSITYASIYDSNKARRLRELVKQIIEKVKLVVKTMGFAERTLMLGDDDVVSVVNEVKKSGEFSGVDDSVITSLAIGDGRALFLD